MPPPEALDVDDLVAARPDLSTALKGFEKRYIESLLNENKWARGKVADLLGIDRRTLFRKIQSLDIK